MPVYDRSARDTLTLSPSSAPAPWAFFDPDWYRSRYPGAPDGAAEDVLEWHLSHGQARGHSPNIYFDEAWQRRAWPGIAGLIASGACASAFDAWCRGAHAARAPHWLFDPAEYRDRSPSLTDDVLAEASLINLYDHYLRFGAPEGRIGHPLFDPASYLSGLDPKTAEAAAANPFAHYLHALDSHPTDARTSILFDPEWYRTGYPGVTGYRSLLEHYLCNDTPTAFDPSPWFSEQYYIAQNPGLADAIGETGFRNGFAHFLAHGQREGRSPHPRLDLAWYAARENVRADLAAELAKDAFSHWIAIGQPAGLLGVPEPEVQAGEAHAIALYQGRARTIWPLFGRRKLDFTLDGAARVSVVMGVRTRIEDTMVSLHALRAQLATGIELILIDSDVSRSGLDIDTHVAGAVILRFSADLNPAAVRESGLICASAETMLFLADGVELAPGAVAAGLARLDGDPGIAAVATRLIQPHGVLHEAGGIVWRDGRLHPYCRGSSPLAPEANFVRDTDYGSTLFMLARRDIVTALPDQASGLAGSKHDAADLCARIWQAGYRVVYEPDSVGFLTNTPEPADSDGQAAFQTAHASWLATRAEFDPDAMIRARSPAAPSLRVLFIEDSVPLRRIGSGFVRSNDVLHAVAAAGAAVTVFPMAANQFALAAIRAELPDRIEVMHDRSIADFDAFLAARQDAFDLIWIARTHNLDQVRAALSPLLAGPTPPRLLVDTEAVGSARLAMRAAALGEAFDLDQALREEFRHLGLASGVIAVNDAEAAMVGAHYPGRVTVLGHAIAPKPTPRGFAERSGILFVGAIHDMDHPNYDGLAWFADNVLPLIEKALGWETRLTVAGYTAPWVSLDRFKPHPRITLRGAVPDLVPLYDAARVFIAPARFAAGIPYKVHEAAAFGVPVVTTDLLAQQLGWTDGESLCAASAADAEGIADRIIALYRDEALWTRVRNSALARVAAELDPTGFAERVKGLLFPANFAPVLISDYTGSDRPKNNT